MFRRRQKTDTKVPINEVLDLPDDVVVETPKGFFYIKNKTRFKIPTPRVLASWRITNVPFYTEDSLKNYMTINTLKFRSGTLIENAGDGKRYFVSASKLRHITNPDWYERLGLNDNDVIIVSQEEINDHSLGEDLA